MRFQPGRIVATANLLSTLPDVDLSPYITRHLNGDWGEVCPAGAQLNEEAVSDGLRILSAYTVNDTKIWIITEADRSSTTVLLPEDY